MALNGLANQLATESTLTSTPPPLRARIGAKALARASKPNTFTSISRRSASSAPAASIGLRSIDSGIVEQQVTSGQVIAAAAMWPRR